MKPNLMTLKVQFKISYTRLTVPQTVSSTHTYMARVPPCTDHMHHTAGLHYIQHVTYHTNQMDSVAVTVLVLAELKLLCGHFYSIG